MSPKSYTYRITLIRKQSTGYTVRFRSIILELESISLATNFSKFRNAENGYALLKINTNTLDIQICPPCLTPQTQTSWCAPSCRLSARPSSRMRILGWLRYGTLASFSGVCSGPQGYHPSSFILAHTITKSSPLLHRKIRKCTLHSLNQNRGKRQATVIASHSGSTLSCALR